MFRKKRSFELFLVLMTSFRQEKKGKKQQQQQGHLMMLQICRWHPFLKKEKETDSFCNIEFVSEGERTYQSI